MHRIYIVGAAGSGKTTLALQLAKVMQAPVYELDAVFYEGGFGPLYPEGIRTARLEQIAEQSAWIVEGGAGYLKAAENLLEVADTIIWLDLSGRVTGWRIITRHIKADLAGNNRHKGYLKLYRFYLDNRKFYRYIPTVTMVERENIFDAGVNRHTTGLFLQYYSQKLIYCRSTKDVKRVIASVKSTYMRNEQG